MYLGLCDGNFERVWQQKHLIAAFWYIQNYEGHLNFSIPRINRTVQEAGQPIHLSENCQGISFYDEHTFYDVHYSPHRSLLICYFFLEYNNNLKYIPRYTYTKI